jgi:methionyl-tRNA formyltransferase
MKSEHPPVDLYLGSAVGLWALDQVRPEEIGLVFTFDEDIAAAATGLGLDVRSGDANELEFEAAPVAFSVHYPRIIRPHLIARYRNIYNLHPGYLPWGRGFYPVFWALWENTPAGATLHEITAGVDEGPVVGQIQVDYDEADTGGSLHEGVRMAEEQLFRDFWPSISAGRPLPAVEQPQSGGSAHLKKEFFELKQQARWEEMTASELVKLVRCLSFPGYSGLEITLGGKRFALNLEDLEQ